MGGPALPLKHPHTGDSLALTGMAGARKASSRGERWRGGPGAGQGGVVVAPAGPAMPPARASPTQHKALPLKRPHTGGSLALTGTGAHEETANHHATLHQPQPHKRHHPPQEPAGPAPAPAERASAEAPPDRGRYAPYGHLAPATPAPRQRTPATKPTPWAAATATPGYQSDRPATVASRPASTDQVAPARSLP